MDARARACAPSLLLKCAAVHPKTRSPAKCLGTPWKRRQAQRDAQKHPRAHAQTHTKCHMCSCQRLRLTA
eukprot:7070577-Alexandrium_andersonii.AAC.1